MFDNIRFCHARSKTIPLSVHAALLDFDPSPISAVFQPTQEELCVDIPIINDGMAGESREMFVVAFSIPETGLSVSFDQLLVTTIMINDIPGESV